MEQSKLEKIAETFQDEEFMKRIMEMEKQEEIIKAFADEKNITLSAEEVNEFIQKGRELTKQIRLEKIVELMKDKEFVERIAKIEKKEDIINAFAAKGLELSMEEIDELIQKGQEVISNGEFDRVKKALSEDKLENVSGGTVTDDFKTGVDNLTNVIGQAANTVTNPSCHSSSDYVQAAGTLAVPIALTVLAAAPVVCGVGKGLYKGTKTIKNVLKKSPAVVKKACAATASYATACGTCFAMALLPTTMTYQNR